MKLIPMQGRVILKRLDAVTKSAGGIIIPDAAAERPVKAKVIAVGPISSLEETPIVVEENDVVLIPRSGYSELRVDGDVLIVMKHEDILAVCKEDTTSA